MEVERRKERSKGDLEISFCAQDISILVAYIRIPSVIFHFPVGLAYIVANDFDII
jgi:hypothetical protein